MFLLIGLQVRPIVVAVDESSLGSGTIALAAAATLVGVVVLRAAWVALTRAVLTRVPRADEAPEPVPVGGHRGDLVGGHAGRGDPGRRLRPARGDAAPGGPGLHRAGGHRRHPARAGLDAPVLIRRLGLAAPDHHQDALQAADVFQRAAVAGRARLDELQGELDDVAPEVVERLRTRSLERADSMWERLGRRRRDPQPGLRAAPRRDARGRAGRGAAHPFRRHGPPRGAPAGAHGARRGGERARAGHGVLDGRAGGGPRGPGRAQHLVRAPRRGPHAGSADPTGRRRLRGVPPRRAPPGSTSGSAWRAVTWVAATPAPRRHAAAHFAESAHPVMRSFELGEAWRWCYEDDLLG